MHLIINPITYNETKHFLTHDQSSWIVVKHLPQELKEYCRDNFDAMFNIHDEERGKVMVFNKDHSNPEWNELTTARWCKSYLKTPQFDNTVMKSYMFSGEDNTNINEPLPDVFDPLYQHMQKQDDRYNQVVVNWYQDDDYISQHSDCEASMVDGHSIAIVNINPNNTNRLFEMLAKDSSKTAYDSVKIVLVDGIVIEMCGNTQSMFTHGVPPGFGKRISLTLRQY